MKEPIICHICNFKPEYGGTFIDSLLYLNRYCRIRLSLNIFCIFLEEATDRKWLTKLDDEGVRYGFVPASRKIMSHVRVLLDDYDPIIFHTHFYLFDMSALFLKLMVYRRSKVVWHYHSAPDLTLRQRIKDVFKIRLAFNRLGDRCIAVGEGVYQGLKDAGMAKDKSVLIHNAVDVRRFLQTCEITPEARGNLQIPMEHTVFLLLGWDPIRKGVDILYRAAEELYRRNYKNCRFLVVGRTDARKTVSQLLCKSELSQDSFRVIEPVEDFTSLLKGVDVFVSASRSEGLTYATLEAMTAGKVILSSDIPAVRETYGRSQGVWLFPSEDWKSLARLMEKTLLLQSDKRRSLGQANSQYIIENHSLDQWTKKVGHVYKELIGMQKQLQIKNSNDDSHTFPSEVTS